MTFEDDEQTIISRDSATVNDNFDVVSVRFQMRATELEAIATGTEADKDAFIEWLTPAPAEE